MLHLFLSVWVCICTQTHRKKISKQVFRLCEQSTFFVQWYCFLMSQSNNLSVFSCSHLNRSLLLVGNGKSKLWLTGKNKQGSMLSCKLGQNYCNYTGGVEHKIAVGIDFDCWLVIFDCIGFNLDWRQLESLAPSENGAAPLFLLLLLFLLSPWLLFWTRSKLLSWTAVGWGG